MRPAMVVRVLWRSNGRSRLLSPRVGSSSSSDFVPMKTNAVVPSPAHGSTRRAEVQAMQVAARREIEQLEWECRKELGELYKYYSVDALNFSQRHAEKQRQQEYRQHAKVEKAAYLAHWKLSVCIDEDERQQRNAIAIDQEKDRRLLERKQTLEFDCVCVLLRLQQLVRAEDRKRYCLEKNETAEFAALQQQYIATPWKPTVKVLGRCPFVRKACCPFQDPWKKCHGMLLSEEHYQHSIVETHGKDMM